MPKFGVKSTKNLTSCHHDLVKLFQEVVKEIDCSVICGHRGQKDQEDAFLGGNSHLRWPHSKHNDKPSMAIDVMPYPVSWAKLSRIYYLAGYVMRVADEMGLVIRWGGSWKTGPDRHDLEDVKFKDLAHYELVTEGGNDGT